MVIGLGSQSAIKVTAVENAIMQYDVRAQLVAVKASSGIAEQPFDGETRIGAENRAAHAAQLVDDADFTIAIESGIFRHAARYFDIAVVVARLSTGEIISVDSDPVEFPADAVEETIRRGAQTWTCGKVMQEWGLVAKHDDPHLSLSGKSRREFINEAVSRLFEQLRSRGVL